MRGWTGEDLGAALGVPPVVTGALAGISTDTRTLRPGSAFVALTGEQFDGHDHLAAARDAGAVLAVVRHGTRPVEGLPLLVVDDPLHAYGALAAWHRARVSGPVIAIGGSNGKTSTRAMVAAVAATRWPVHATTGNLNNLVGVPQTVLAAPGHSALVVEAGASVPGEMARHREVLRPDVAIVTNIAAEHLEGFGSLEGVFREELALVDGVPLAIVGAEPPELAARARARAHRVLDAGLARGGVRPDRWELDAAGQARVEVDGVGFRLPLPGLHLAGNAMLAWAVVREFDLPREEAAAALESVRVPGGRTEVVRAGGMVVLDDSYNANPASFLAAIETARAMRGNRRLVFVAGSMRELGPASGALHAEVARALVALDPDLLAGVGAFVAALAPHAAALGDRLVLAPDAPRLAAVLPGLLRGDELVVLKASRGEALERILPAITARATPAT